MEELEILKAFQKIIKSTNRQLSPRVKKNMLKNIKRFNKENGTNFYVHFKKFAQTPDDRWFKVSFSKDGTTIIETIAGANGKYRVSRSSDNLHMITTTPKKKNILGIQGRLAL